VVGVARAIDIRHPAGSPEIDLDLKLALSGVNLKEPVRVVFFVAPPAGLEPATWSLTPTILNLIEDSLRLTPRKGTVWFRPDPGHPLADLLLW